MYLAKLLYVFQGRFKHTEGMTNLCLFIQGSRKADLVSYFSRVVFVLLWNQYKFIAFNISGAER